MSANAHKHAALYRRCLETADVDGLLRLWAHTDPHLPQPDPAAALVSLHMARIEAKFISRKLKAYSKDFLEERGYRKIDGKWSKGMPKKIEVIEGSVVGSISRYPKLAKEITHAMTDALLDSLAGGTTEAEVHREKMLKARYKVKSRLGLI